MTWAMAHGMRIGSAVGVVLLLLAATAEGYGTVRFLRLVEVGPPPPFDPDLSAYPCPEPSGGGAGTLRWRTSEAVPTLHNYGDVLAASMDCGSYIGGTLQDPNTFTRQEFIQHVHPDGSPAWTVLLPPPSTNSRFNDLDATRIVLEGAPLDLSQYAALRTLEQVYVVEQGDTSNGAYGRLLHYNSEGAIVCTALRALDYFRSVAAGPVYSPARGTTYDTGAFVTGSSTLYHYNWNCDLVWSVNLGHRGRAVSIEESGGVLQVYVAGENFGDNDWVLSRYTCTLPCDSPGTFAWSATWAPGWRVYGVAAYEGSASGAYVSGVTDTRVAGLAKFDDSGNLLWSRTADFTSGAFASDVAARRGGGAILTGGQDGASSPAFQYTSFVGAYDSAGNLDWSDTWCPKTVNMEPSGKVAVAANGDVLALGRNFRCPTNNGLFQAVHSRYE